MTKVRFTLPLVCIFLMAISLSLWPVHSVFQHTQTSEAESAKQKRVITIDITGLCYITFKNQKAYIGILKTEPAHHPHAPRFTLDNNLIDINLFKDARLEVIPSQNTASQLTFNKTLYDENKTATEWSFDYALNFSKLFPENPVEFDEENGVVGFMSVNQGEFSVTQLCSIQRNRQNPDPSAPPTKIMFAEEGSTQEIARVTKERFVGEIIRIKIVLQPGDRATLKLASGDIPLTRHSHSILIANNPVSGPSGDPLDSHFDMYYGNLIKLEPGQKKVLPQLFQRKTDDPSRRDGSPLCNPGVNCKPPSLCQ